MSYVENEKGEVVLTMTRTDYDLLLIAFGAALAISATEIGAPAGVPVSILVPLLNRINQGNPYYVPYGKK